MSHSHGGNVYAAARRYGMEPGEFVDFSASINPLGPPPGVLGRLSGELRNVVRYPDPECAEACEALAGFLGVGADCLLVTNGGAEAIYAAVRGLGARRLIVVSPTFSEYGLAAESCGVPVRTVPLYPERDFAFDPAQVESELLEGDAVVICNPNNPTGTLTEAKAIQRLVETAASKRAFVVVDEAFIDFVTERAAYSVAPLAPGAPNLVVVGSLTKFFALPGLRIGYAAAAPALVARMNRAKPPWSVNSLAQAAAAEALRDRGYIERTVLFVAAERDRFAGELARIPGVRVRPPFPPANFILLNIQGLGLTATRLAGILASRGVLIRDCSGFQGLGKYWIRVAVLRPEANDRLVGEMLRIAASRPPELR